MPATRRTEAEKLGEFGWDLYDIESYLLDAEYISQAVGQITLRRTGEIPVARVETLLRSCAREVWQEVVNSQLVEYVRRKLKAEINGRVRRPGHGGRISEDDLARLVVASKEAAAAICDAAEATTEEELAAELGKLRAGEDSTEVWDTDGWKTTVPGKRVLQKVAETLAGEGSSIQVRNVVVGLMARDGHKPAGMKETIQRALAYRRESGD